MHGFRGVWNIVSRILEAKDEEDDMREAFSVFDQNGDGYVTDEELRLVSASMRLEQGRTIRGVQEDDQQG